MTVAKRAICALVVPALLCLGCAASQPAAAPPPPPPVAAPAPPPAAAAPAPEQGNPQAAPSPKQLKVKIGEVPEEVLNNKSKNP